MTLKGSQMPHKIAELNFFEGHWNEMSVSKGPSPGARVVQASIGHDGQHALLLTDDGLVYFAGTSKRGEDGDGGQGSKASSRSRAPKPVKPKKIHRVEGFTVVDVAANNGTSALVTKDGDLFVFGKDSAHTDYTSGRVSDLKGVHVVKVNKTAYFTIFYCGIPKLQPVACLANG